MNFKILGFLIVLIWAIPGFAQVDVLDSGGPLIPEQASYDVRFYHLELEIFPDEQSIKGSVTVRADILNPISNFVLDLDPELAVLNVENERETKFLNFERKKGKIWIELGETKAAGSELELKIYYGGKPRVAPNPPWNGGFSWEKTSTGAHWIATSCQTQGADLWWPNKDHVSDEPDSMALTIKVPSDLVVATNGRLNKVRKNKDKSKTIYHWYISTPINNYNVALNIAPYKVIEDEMKSISGDMIPLFFYVLPEDFEKGKVLMEEIKDHLRFYEKYLGPYPFRRDKYGVAQTPHLGMEHQTIIAYGANFDNTSMTRGKDWGFDALHHHELGHEWWGNLITNGDWKDMWIHEGFCTYMQALYMEEKGGKKAYHEYINSMQGFANRAAVGPRGITSARTIYRAPIYSKGATVLHSLRYLIGDQHFFKALRRFCYPDPAIEAITDGSHCRFVDTDDFINLCEEITGMELDWFFDVYVRQPGLPTLLSEDMKIAPDDSGASIKLKWSTPDDLPFKMPIEAGGQKVTITNEWTEVSFAPRRGPEIDPDNWVLKNKK